MSNIKKMKQSDMLTLSLIELELLFKHGEMNGMTNTAQIFNLPVNDADRSTFDEYMLRIHKIMVKR